MLIAVKLRPDVPRVRPFNILDIVLKTAGHVKRKGKDPERPEFGGQGSQETASFETDREPAQGTAGRWVTGSASRKPP